MLYFVTETLFGVYAVVYSITLQPNGRSHYELHGGLIFLLCSYFSILSLWFIFQNDLYLITSYLHIDKLTIILKMMILFLGLLSSFLITNSVQLVQLSYLLAVGSYVLNYNSLILAVLFLIIVWSLEILIKYVKCCNNLVLFTGEELGITILVLGSLLVLFFDTISIVFWFNYLVFIGLNALFGFGLLHALSNLNNQDCSVCINWFIVLNLRNLILLGVLFKFMLVSEWILQLFFLIGILNLIIGTSILMMQTAIYPIILGTVMSCIGYTLVLAGIGLNKILIVLFYLALVVPVMAFVATVNHLSRDKKLVNIHDLSGVIHMSLGIGLSLLISIFSIIGVPLTVGFLGKFWAISSMLNSVGLMTLTIVIFNQVITTVSYFKILKIVVLDQYVFNYNKSKFGKYSIGLLIISVLIILYTFWFSYVEVMSN